MIIDQFTLKRLSFLKYLYLEGVEQSKKDEPSCTAAILYFHDAVEHFLLLCAEKTGARTKKRGFMEYWKIIEKASGKKLSHEIDMDRLNRTRNNLKHSGIFPDKFHVEEFQNMTIFFFEKNCRSIFDIDFADIDELKHQNRNMTEDTEFIKVPEPPEEKSPVRRIYAALIIPQASKKVYRDYLLVGYVTSVFIIGLLMVPLWLLNEKFSDFDLLAWAILYPLLAFLTIYRPNNPYTDFFVNDPFSLVYLVFIGIIFIAVIVSVFVLSFEAERNRKEYYPQLLRDVLEQNRYIEIKELAKFLKISAEVIDTWSETISPEFMIKREGRYLVTTRRSISDTGIKKLFQKLHDAQVEVDNLGNNKSN